MIYRKDAVLTAVAGLLASCGFASAAIGDVNTTLSLNPTVITADEAAAPAAPAERAPLMMALDKVGAAKPLDDLGLNIYGWIESGYTYNHRHGSDNFPIIIPGPFNHEYGNHYMLNQVDLRFERLIADPKKLDVGGLVELMYGTDAAAIHSNGMELGNENGGTATTADTSENGGLGDRFHPQYQFDIAQAYVDVSVPIGNGLIIRTGKFISLMGYESVDPRANAFYSHSYLFLATPYNQTGILGIYQLNDQWKLQAGISRGWDQTLEDNNGAIDGLGQFVYAPDDKWSISLNWTVGPENPDDSSHYRVVIDPVVTWKVTEQLSLGAEALYLYDGGVNGDASIGQSHAYGDVWGVALYAGYKVNDYLTLNGRAEKAHSLLGGFGGIAAGGTSDLIPALNAYEVTLGVTLTPLPKDPIGKNLTIRPEVRYDFTDSSAFKFYPANGTTYKDQLTFAADVIFAF